MSSSSASIIIDVFRAFTTACYILEKDPSQYVLSNSSEKISQFFANSSDSLLIGKEEIGARVNYDIPNSPTRVLEEEVSGKRVFHRTQAGATGILDASRDDLILAAAFVNADATVAYLQRKKIRNIKIIPMGHEGKTPSLEDDLCASYIEKKLKGEKFDISKFIPQLKEGSGKYFFTDDQLQYPSEDFHRCLELNRFSFAIRAEKREGFAYLERAELSDSLYPSQEPVVVNQE